MKAASQHGGLKLKTKKTQKREDAPSPYSMSKAWNSGDGITKASLLVFGLGNLLRKQFAKGIAFLLIEIAAVVFFATKGVKALKELPGLGTGESERVKVDGFWVYQKSEPSVVLLLDGVAVVFLLIVVLWLATLAMRSAYKAQTFVEQRGKARSLKEDLYALTDEDAPILLMTLPTAGIIVFTILPLIFMISMAFTSYDSGHVQKFDWVGLENFAKVFANDGGEVNLKLFTSVLVWTLTWAFFATTSSVCSWLCSSSVKPLMARRSGVQFSRSLLLFRSSLLCWFFVLCCSQRALSTACCSMLV